MDEPQRTVPHRIRESLDKHLTEQERDNLRRLRERITRGEKPREDPLGPIDIDTVSC